MNFDDMAIALSGLILGGVISFGINAYFARKSDKSLSKIFERAQESNGESLFNDELIDILLKNSAHKNMDRLPSSEQPESKGYLKKFLRSFKRLNTVSENISPSIKERVKSANELGLKYLEVYPNYSLQIFEKSTQLSNDSWEAPYVLGRLLYSQKDYVKAKEYFEIAFVRGDSHSIEGVSVASSSQNMIGLCEYQLNDLGLAMKYFREAIKQNRESGSLAQLACIYMNVSMVYMDKGFFKRAKKISEVCLKIFKKIGLKEYELCSILRMGAASSSLPDEEIQQALSIYFRVDDERYQKVNCGSKIRIYLNISKIYLDMQNFKNAEEYALKAKEIANGDLAKYQAITLNSLSIIYRFKGSMDESIEFAKIAIKKARQYGNDEDLSRSYLNLGSAYSNIENLSKGFDFLFAAREALNGSRSLSISASIALELGVLYSRSGKRKEVISELEIAISDFKENGDKHGLASALGNLGAEYLALGNLPRGEEIINQSSDIFTSIGSAQGKFINEIMLAKSYFDRGDITAVNEHLNACEQLIDDRGEEIFAKFMGGYYKLKEAVSTPSKSQYSNCPPNNYT